MRDPILVIMAAGMGSRYGGPKQIDPVGAHGEILIDYSIYDALKAGFRRVVCILTKRIEADFKEILGDRLGRICEVRYAYQTGVLPEGFAPPADRAKPWGTGHAILSCGDLIDAPFCVINADDYYGPGAFRSMYDFLRHAEEPEEYAMVGYRLSNTLTENGHVARGVCTVEGGWLRDIQERTHLEPRDGGPAYTENGEWFPLSPESTVSMNLWGFTPGIMPELERQFHTFLREMLPRDPRGAEFFLPEAVRCLLAAGKVRVRVFPSEDRWYGVTYRQDKPAVERAIAEKTAGGVYPADLWEEFER